MKAVGAYDDGGGNDRGIFDGFLKKEWVS